MKQIFQTVLRCLGIVSLLLAPQPLAAEQPPIRPLLKILVAPDHRTFVTEDGKPFVPFGVNYYRPDTGWAPQLWKQFNREATRKDFVRMKALGVNCVRVFLTYKSFHTEPGQMLMEGVQKFDQFIDMAEAAGIYVHPAGPEFWEGPPNWKPVAIADERTLQATEGFWRQFAGRYANRNVIFAYDLKNEPDVGWNLDIIRSQWNRWLQEKYQTKEKVATAWRMTNEIAFGKIPIPAATNDLKNPRLLDFQNFREHIADEWTRRQAEAIKSAAPKALVTVGCLQTSVPSRFWGGIADYTGFRPERQARFLDFLEIHFYPSEGGGYEYKTRAGEQANMSYLEGIVGEVAKAGKPVVLAEFGWYGGKEKPKFDKGAHPQATEEQQAEYCRHLIETSSGFAAGWLNWGLYDTPAATDCSEQTGLLTPTGEEKAWGRTFRDLSKRYQGRLIPAKKISARPELDWSACVTSTKATKEFRDAYLKAFLADQKAP